MRKLFLIAAVLCMTAAVVHAQSVTKQKAFYDAITYNWTDASNVSHTSKLTDKATDPYQIVALLEKVYSDPKIPGPYYSAYGQINANTTGSGWDKKTDYSVDMDVRTDPVDYTYKGDDGIWTVSSSQPQEEGYTVLLVSVKNSFTSNVSNFIRMKSKTQANYYWYSETTFGRTELKNSPRDLVGLDNREALIDYITGAIDYVQLLTDGMRMGEDSDAGTLFAVNGNINRFFFLSKGQARKAFDSSYINAPFGSMFEQFSPAETHNAGETEAITDFYDTMSKGEAYPVKHDCNSVLEQQHYFSMSGPTGTTAYDMTGLCLFVPDHRLDWNGTINKSTNQNNGSITDNRDYSTSGTSIYASFSNYNTNHQPYTFLYTIQLTATAEQYGDSENHKYQVTLNWKSSLSKIVDNVTEEFDIYLVVNGVVQSEPLKKDLTTNTYSYIVDQRVSGYEISYVVVGRPKEATFSPIQSNIATVEIPGYDPQERLKLAINGDYISVYNYGTQCNDYTDTITVSNGVGTSVNRTHLTSNPTISVIRSWIDKDSVEQSVVIANLTFSNVSSNSSNCNYTLSYVASTQNTTKSDQAGTFSFDNDGDLDFNSLVIVDNFSADVSKNQHPSGYTYQLKFTSATPVLDVDGNSVNEIYSNKISVPVYKTETTLLGGYTQQQVESDTNRPNDASVVLNLYDNQPLGIGFNVVNSPNVFRYYADRSEDNSNFDEYSQAQRTTDGNYVISYSDNVRDAQNVATTGATSIPVELRDYTLAKTLVDDNVLSEQGKNNDHKEVYNAVIETFRTKSSTHNTYGAKRQQASVCAVTAEVTNKVLSNGYTFKNASGDACRYYCNTLRINYQCPSDAKLMKVRVWRETADGVAYEKENDETYIWRSNQVGAPDVVNIADGKTITYYNNKVMDGTTPEGRTEAISDAVLDTQSGTLTINDYFGAIDVKGNNRSFPVTYYVRAYYLTAEGTYAIDQYTMNVTMDGSVISGLTQLSPAASPVVGVAYVNALGQTSATPQAGVNVVITRYADGSVTREKKVF